MAVGLGYNNKLLIFVLIWISFLVSPPITLLVVLGEGVGVGRGNVLNFFLN